LSSLIKSNFGLRQFFERVGRTDRHLAAAGSAGTASIYTTHVKPNHTIRKVLLRQIAILN
jgi:hypothetical protein